MIKLIVAMNQHGVIGKDNTIPWRYPADLKRFKALTEGHVVIMGRRTWESLPPKFRPLPNRINVILTRSGSKDFRAPEDALTIGSLGGAILYCASHFPDKDVWVIGGGEIYKEALEEKIVEELYVTEVPDKVEGDNLVYFPTVITSSNIGNLSHLEMINREPCPEHDGVVFTTLRVIRGPA